MKANIRVKGLKELEANAKKMRLDLSNANRRVFTQEAHTLKNLIKSKVGIRRGLLYEAIVDKKWKDEYGVTGFVIGITHESSRSEFRVGKNGAYYYPASQEYGWTSNGTHYPGKPYIRPSWDERKSKIRSNARKAYKEIIDRARG